MTRLIDADELLDKIPAEWKLMEVGMLITAPTVDAVPVVHAHWKNIGSGHAECSNCGMTVSADYPASPCVHYCAKCGAKMNEEEK